MLIEIEGSAWSLVVFDLLEESLRVPNVAKEKGVINDPIFREKVSIGFKYLL